MVYGGLCWHQKRLLNHSDTVINQLCPVLVAVLLRLLMSDIRGYDCLRKYAVESKASNPELLSLTKLRKHVATLCQLLNLDQQELEQVACFMGHDIRVHCEYYHQTDKAFQVAKTGKLFTMEKGAGSLKENSLTTRNSVVFGMLM